MKKNLVLILCLSLIFILVGCNSDKKANNSVQATNENQEADLNNKNSTQPAKINSNEQAVKDRNNDSQKITKVNSKVKLYDGTYFDNRLFGENTLNKYCEVVISNVTNTSFNFTIYEVNELYGKKENKKVIFLTNTEVFTGDGTKAAFYGKNYTLNFTFPNNHNAYPVVTDIEISGFEPLKGKTYVNNGIPGHEFG